MSRGASSLASARGPAVAAEAGGARPRERVELAVTPAVDAVVAEHVDAAVRRDSQPLRLEVMDLVHPSRPALSLVFERLARGDPVHDTIRVDAHEPVVRAGRRVELATAHDNVLDDVVLVDGRGGAQPLIARVDVDVGTDAGGVHGVAGHGERVRVELRHLADVAVRRALLARPGGERAGGDDHRRERADNRTARRNGKREHEAAQHGHPQAESGSHRHERRAHRVQPDRGMRREADERRAGEAQRDSQTLATAHCDRDRQRRHDRQRDQVRARLGVREAAGGVAVGEPAPALPREGEAAPGQCETGGYGSSAPGLHP